MTMKVMMRDDMRMDRLVYDLMDGWMDGWMDGNLGLSEPFKGRPPRPMDYEPQLLSLSFHL